MTYAKIILLIFLTSCSATWHMKKAVKKNPDIIQTKRDTVSIYIPKFDTIMGLDTFYIRTSYTRFDTIIDVKYIAPKTRYQTRIEYKTHRDTVRLIRYITKQEARNIRADVRLQRSKQRWYLWLIGGIILGLFLRDRLPF